MTVSMTALTTSGSETYTTSAKVGRSVDTSALAAVSAQALTDCIVYAQNEIDAWLATDYTVPFTTVPELIQEIARDLASAEVVKRTLSLGNGTAGGTEKMRAFRENAIANIRLITGGELNLYTGTTLTARKFDRETLTLVTAATPAASMTIVTGMDSFDLRNHRLIGVCTATSGSPTGIVKITGTLDEREEFTEEIYFDGQREVRLNTPFQFVTAVDGSGLTGGTSPLFALKGVRNTGKAFSGRRAG